MITIYKYEIKSEDSFSIEMPLGSKILSLQLQHNIPHIWALVDTERRMEKRDFKLFGTGHVIPKENYTGRKFIGTFQTSNHLVFHLFEVNWNRVIIKK